MEPSILAGLPMESSLSLSDLLLLLPRGDDFITQDLPVGLSYVAEPSPSFVEPRLAVQRPVETGKTALILISAPGAVGKTTLARQISSRTGAALWDLSKLNVGSKTFAGTVLEGWGTEAHGVLKRISDGRWLFVLDALDEAQVRAGGQNFEAFLSDLAEIWKQPRSRPTVVLLARTDTADLVELVLESNDVPVARLQVEYFNRQQAIEFIDKRLDAKRSIDKRQPTHRQHERPFADAREFLFNLIYPLFEAGPASAWDDPRVRDFLGYAPVLETLAEYLDVDNYKRLVEELKGGDSGRDPWRFLTTIVNRLQLREQQKLRDNVVTPVLMRLPAASGWVSGTQLYDKEEQSERLLRYSLRLPPPTKLAADMPAPVRDKYEERLGESLPTHPFLSGRRFANLVFKEFTYAWGMMRADPQTQESFRALALKREEPFLPSPLLSRFVASYSDVIDGQDFGIVYESLLARSASVELSLVQTETEIDAHVVLPDESGRDISIRLLDTGSGIRFLRRLRDADIDVASAITLGGPEQRFALGPSVDVTCNEFLVLCEHLDVDAAQGVWIRATGSTSNPNLRIRIRDPNAGRLAVIWPKLGHPWAAYQAPPELAPAILGETSRGDALRKLLLMFRRQRVRKADTVRNARWSQEQRRDRDELIHLALGSGVLVEGKYDSLEFASDFDSLKSLVDERPRLSPRAHSFVVAYLGAPFTARVLAHIAGSAGGGKS